MPALPTTTPAPRRRSLVPHEHGAWGQLAMPLLAALALGAPAAAPYLLTAAVVLAFTAHEPLLVLLGQRGRRVRDEEGPRARRWLLVLGGGALLLGVPGIALAPPDGRAAVLLPAVLAAGVAVLVYRRLEKTTLGEIWVAAALASAGYAVARAGGVAQAAALAALLAWILAFAAATLAVQVILVRVRSKGAEDPGLRHAGLVLLLVGVAAAAVRAGLPGALLAAVIPTALLSLVVCLVKVSPRRLRELGWALVGASTVTLAVLVVMLR